MNDIKKQKETPQTVRGMAISELSVEKLKQNKAEKHVEDEKIKRITWAGIAVYMLFFTFLSQILKPIAEIVTNLGLGIQAIVTTFVMMGINTFFRRYNDKFPLLKNRALTQMLQAYALLCIVIALVSVNNLPPGLLELAP